jgi:hypothetical protein
MQEATLVAFYHLLKLFFKAPVQANSELILLKMFVAQLKNCRQSEWRPQIVVVENKASAAQCQHLISTQ